MHVKPKMKVRFLRDYLDRDGWLLYPKGTLSTVSEAVASGWIRRKLAQPAYLPSNREEFRHEYILFNLRAITLHLGVLLNGASSQTDRSP